MKYWDWKDCERWMKRNMEDGNSRFYNFLKGICRNKMLAERQRILRSFVLSFDRDWRGVIILSRPIFIRWINGRSLLGNGIFSGAVYKYSNSILLEKERERRGVEKIRGGENTLARNGKFRSPGKKGSWCYVANRISLAQAKCNNASKIEHALKYERDQWPTYTTLLNASQSAEWTFSFERERRANTQVESFHGSQTRSAERFTSLVYEATNPLIRPVYTRINIQRGKGIVETNSLRGPSPSIRRARKNRIDTTLKHTQILEILKISKIIFKSTNPQILSFISLDSSSSKSFADEFSSRVDRKIFLRHR